MNKARLLKLAGLLEADAANRKGIMFDMSTWGRISDAKNPVSCNTTACAMGLAAISGKFKRAGLGYRMRGLNQILITMRGRDGAISAAAELFDIPECQAHVLFTVWRGTGRGARSERALARRLREFVATGKL